MSDSDPSDSDSNTDSSSSGGGGRRSKVKRIIDERGFDGFGDELERRWTTDGDDRASLRELADEFNRHVFADEAEGAGMQFLEGEAENFYEKLTDDDVDPETRVAVERRLNREGIDTNELTSDFVTHQAIHTYLTTYRDASMSTPDPADRLTDGRNTINRLQSRLSNVTANTLRTLESVGSIGLGNADVFVNVTVTCNDCGAQKEVNALLDDGGCDCEQ
jgi:hypothetical protein